MTFQEYIAARLNRPFEWGRNDCITFAIGWVNERTGQDWLKELPTWATDREAFRIVKDLGGLEAAFDARFKRISPTAARDGDLALIDKTALLFCGRYVVGPDIGGCVFLDRKVATCAWSV